MEMNNQLLAGLQHFNSISLQKLDDVKFMNRIDQKFILHQQELNNFLEDIQNEYDVLDIQGKRIFKYSSLYFDTDFLNFYADHHNGKPNRVKIRHREYQDTNTSFFEIKKKLKGSRTEKFRIEITGNPLIDKQSEQSLLKQHQLDHISLHPTILIDYCRITLSAKDLSERVTIDIGLQFQKQNLKESLENLVIIEVKQNKVKRESAVIKALRKRRNRPLGISKYATGMVLMNAVQKTNAFKHKILKIKQLISTNGANRSI